MTKPLFFTIRKKVIFFDLNHTLIDQKSSFRACFVEVLDEFTGRWDKGDINWDSLKIAQQFEQKLYKARHTRKGAKLSIRKLQCSSLRAILAPYPIVVNDEFLRSFFSLIKQQQPSHYKLYPDTINVLTTLARQYKLGLISNRSNLDLAKLGLSKLFTPQQLITPQNSKSRKPKPSIFKYAINAFHVKPSEAVMVGDSWRNDILGATSAGLDAIWIKRRAIEQAAQRRRIGKRRLIIIKNLGQLLEVFGN